MGGQPCTCRSKSGGATYSLAPYMPACSEVPQPVRIRFCTCKPSGRDREKGQPPLGRTGNGPHTGSGAPHLLERVLVPVQAAQEHTLVRHAACDTPNRSQGQGFRPFIRETR